MKSGISAAFPSFTPNRGHSVPRFVASDSGARRKFSALQSRGGDGFSPSSRARSLLWLWTAPPKNRRTPLLT